MQCFILDLAAGHLHYLIPLLVIFDVFLHRCVLLLVANPCRQDRSEEDALVVRQLGSCQMDREQGF